MEVKIQRGNITRDSVIKDIEEIKTLISELRNKIPSLSDEEAKNYMQVDNNSAASHFDGIMSLLKPFFVSCGYFDQYQRISMLYDRTKWACDLLDFSHKQWNEIQQSKESLFSLLKNTSFFLRVLAMTGSCRERELNLTNSIGNIKGTIKDIPIIINEPGRVNEVSQFLHELISFDKYCKEWKDDMTYRRNSIGSKSLVSKSDFCTECIEECDSIYSRATCNRMNKLHINFWIKACKNYLGNYSLDKQLIRKYELPDRLNSFDEHSMEKFFNNENEVNGNTINTVVNGSKSLNR